MPVYLLCGVWELNMTFKLGCGPMSVRINDILARYARDRQKPLMIIASRNQVDADSGYVMTTKQLAEQIAPLRSEYLWLCRDHCGPYFLDAEKGLPLRQVVEATKKTIANDIENGFDLIHIDTSRCESAGYRVADQLFGFCLKLNPNIKFEFGTEENVGTAASIERYRTDVRFARQFPNMTFVVAQTGSLTMEDRQMGSFDVAMVQKLAQIADVGRVKLKEHNADYLTAEQIKLRPQAGVHACNIAPQLGVYQTQVVLNLAKWKDVDTTAFRNLVLNGNKWAKWMLSDVDGVKTLVAGHYHFNSNEYRQLEAELSKHCDLDLEITNAITDCLDLYYTNLS